MKGDSLTTTEQKTGKVSTKDITPRLREQLLQQCGSIYVFEGRNDYRKHRTRQAVYNDLKRAAKRFNLKIELSPHSLRKNYAVYLKRQGMPLSDIQKQLNHTSLETTLIYALSDELAQKFNTQQKKTGD